jgi:uncharacterized DUF497 family protein
VATVVAGDFEWDDAKAEANLAAHGVSFEEGVTAFEDPRHVVLDDGSGLDTFLLIGFSVTGRLLTVVHVERGKRDRIISTWRATRREQGIYRMGHP